MTRLFIFVMVSVLGLVSCGSGYVKPVEASQTGVSLSFFSNVNAVSPADVNVVTSPYSAAVCLSMLAEGAGGTTRTEFDSALGGIMFKAEDLGGNDTLIVESANSIWIDDNFSIRNSYADMLQKDFDAFITTQRFSDPATVKAINNWCLEHTDGKIGDMIDRLSPDMVMVLVNALYFNAPWADSFDPELTSEEIFHGRSRNSKVQMMHRTGQYEYAKLYDTQLIRLPYQGDRYSMYVALPPEGVDLDKVIPQISEERFNSALEMMRPVRVKLSLPKFKVETSMLLNSALQNMGIRTAFTSAADFHGISAMGPLVLDQVKQKCYVQVEEKGTEAAAVTVAQIRLTSVRVNPDDMAVMNVDRPFVFVITDSYTGNIIFAGKIVNL
jgi:serpin B